MLRNTRIGIGLAAIAVSLTALHRRRRRGLERHQGLDQGPKRRLLRLRQELRRRQLRGRPQGHRLQAARFDPGPEDDQKIGSDTAELQGNKAHVVDRQLRLQERRLLRQGRQGPRLLQGRDLTDDLAVAGTHHNPHPSLPTARRHQPPGRLRALATPG